MKNLQLLKSFRKQLLKQNKKEAEKQKRLQEIDRHNAELFIEIEIWDFFQSLIIKKPFAESYILSVAFPNLSRGQEKAYIYTMGLPSKKLNFGRVGLGHASDIAQRFDIQAEYVPESTYGSPEHVNFKIKLS